MVKKYNLPLAALTVLGLTCVANAAQNNRGGSCAPEPPAVCYPETCPECPRCLGPENFAGNPPVCPMTCDGDFFVDASAFYWSAHQDGMEYAIDNSVTNPLVVPVTPATNLNQLADAEYKQPGTKWDWGFKVGIGYCSPCDGWDVSLRWTWFQNKAHSSIDADPTDNRTIIPLWTQFVSAAGSIQFASQADARWKLKLNLVDFELGRNYWVSRYLAIRPFVGVRYASLKQHTNIEYNGGSWLQIGAPPATGSQFGYNGIVDIDNNYRGAGLRAGLDSEWNFGCGWALFGNMAASIIYGKFSVDHDEFIRRSTNPHTETNILDTSESFRASRAMLDLALGIQWSTMFCSCQYGFTAKLGWEQHMFFDQNQMWRVSRTGATPQTTVPNLGSTPPTLNLNGANIYQQRRGSLDAQGWTLTLKFDF